MQMIHKLWKYKYGLAGAAFAASVFALPVTAQTPGLAMLGQLERGGWQLTDRDGGASQRICLGDTAQLIQIRHQRSACTRFVVADGNAEVTVGYDCGTAGYGRTTIRRETNRLVQIETQGVVRGAPFSQTFEGRRIGACG